MRNSLLILILLASVAMAAGTKPVVGPSNHPELEQALKSGLPVVVKLGADWCPPCREMKPIIKALQKEQKGKAIILDIDIEKYPSLANKYLVSAIPTTVFFDKNGKYVNKTVGFMSKEQILKKLDQVRELN